MVRRGHILLELDRIHLTHKMTLMNTMCVIVAKHAAIVDSGQMWHEKGKVVSYDLTLIIHPNLFAQNSGAAGTPKASFVVGCFEQTTSPGHGKILAQVMLLAQYLKTVPDPS